jgi:hypothetical protein
MPGATRSLGGWQPPHQIPDDLAPSPLADVHGQVPYDGKPGPEMFVPIDPDVYKRQTDAIEELGRVLALRTRPDFVWASASGNTDSSGNLVLPIYGVAAGMAARLHRLFVNAAVPATGVRYTAAVPFSNAAAYLELHVISGGGLDAGVPSSALGIQSQCDSAPITAGNPLFPGVFEYSWHQAPEATGPGVIALYIVGSSSLANTVVQARYGLSLTRAAGVA